eukprot:2656068-Rhodomonas_salina.1
MMRSGVFEGADEAIPVALPALLLAQDRLAAERTFVSKSQTPHDDSKQRLTTKEGGKLPCTHAPASPSAPRNVSILPGQSHIALSSAGRELS